MGNGVKREMNWANSSPKTNCSVKFLEPMESPADFRPQPARSRAAMLERKPRRSISVLAPYQHPLQQPEQQVGGERHQRGRNGPGKDHAVVHHGEAAKNKFA